MNEKNINFKIKCIAAKALGFAKSIAAITEKERLLFPSNHYGKDYNNLLNEAKSCCPGMEKIMPPEIKLGTKGKCIQNYIEIATFSQQIYQLMNELYKEKKKKKLT